MWVNAALHMLGLLGGMLLVLAALGVALHTSIRRRNRSAAWLLVLSYSLALVVSLLSAGITFLTGWVYERLGVHGLSWVYFILNLLAWPAMVGVGWALALFHPSKDTNDGTPA